MQPDPHHFDGDNDGIGCEEGKRHWGGGDGVTPERAVWDAIRSAIADRPGD